MGLSKMAFAAPTRAAVGALSFRMIEIGGGAVGPRQLDYITEFSRSSARIAASTRLKGPAAWSHLLSPTVLNSDRPLFHGPGDGAWREEIKVGATPGPLSVPSGAFSSRTFP